MKAIDQEAVGKELQRARKARKLTQSDVAEALHISRTTVTAIESGERKVTYDELERLSILYGRSIHDFLRATRPDPNIAALFRVSSQQQSQQIEAAIIKVEDLARNYVELEELLGRPMTRNYPPEVEGDTRNIDLVARLSADRERTRLSLGDAPVHRLRAILENDVGIRVFSIAMESRFAGFFFYTDSYGACIAVNSNHPFDRKLFTLAHEYGHFIFHRHALEILATATPKAWSPDEQLADSFAYNLLMPEAAVERKFSELSNRKRNATIGDIVLLADSFGTSLDATFRRLETLNLVPTGYWDSIRKDTKVTELRAALAINPVDYLKDELPPRYRMLAAEAFAKGLISEGRLVSILGTDRIEARQIVSSLQIGPI